MSFSPWLLRFGTPGAAAVPLPRASVPRHYPSLDSVYKWIKKLKKQYPDLLYVEQIGESSSLGLPVYALKISDHAAAEEDESALLFSGVHHAREPLGLLMCMRLAEKLLTQYAENDRLRRIVDELEIWIVPVVNPDGYKYLCENELSFPWWRKNLHDNDADGIFNPVIDGVDLNRNYDYNWRQGGEGNPASWFYRGRHPFSEREIAALQQLAIRENIVAGLSFHSYGEVVLYPWGNYYTAPDQKLLRNIGRKLASFMRKLSKTSTYGTLPLNGRVGQSSVWMYGRLRAIDFIVELADEYFTDAEDTRWVLEEGLAAVQYFLKRAMISKIDGHVRDALTQEPLVARVHVLGYEAEYVSSRLSEPIYGRFERWLEPGEYTLEFVADGYVAKRVHGVKVQENNPTHLEISLRKQGQSLPAGNH